MSRGGSESEAHNAFLEIEVKHNAAAVFYKAFTPTISINGHRERRPWGVHRFEVVPGDYEVAISYPWIIQECGRNCVRFSISVGETKRISYCARFIRFIPGKITIA